MLDMLEAEGRKVAEEILRALYDIRPHSRRTAVIWVSPFVYHLPTRR